MVITVDQGIRLLPYGFAKYTVRVNRFHLYFLFVCQAVCLVSSPPKSEFRKRVKLPLSFSFFVVSPPVRSFPYPPNICHCPTCVLTTSYHHHQLVILDQKDINLQYFTAANVILNTKKNLSFHYSIGYKGRGQPPLACKTLSVQCIKI